jgi:uncharacterized protein
MRYPVRILAILFIVLIAASASADTVPDRPARYVVDLAGIVDDGVEMKLNGYLQELEQKTTAQVIVLSVQTLGEMPLEEFSLQVAEKWKLGQKGKDNGLLILFAMQERKYRLEVGYGLEGILPDSLVGSIGRDYIVPFFKKGDYSNGVAAAVLAASQIIAEDSGVQITGMPKITRPARSYGGRKTGSPGILGTVLTILFFIVMIYLFIKHPRLMILFLLFSGMGGRRSRWGGGGGFGGGGFGSFGGGGGGGFGGGGASGGW